MRIKINDGISITKFQKKSEEHIQLKSLLKYNSMKKPFFTVAMLSWNRTDELILVLKDLLKHKIPMNLCLTVQESGSLTPIQRTEIDSLVVQFYAADVEYHPLNRGTGIPRGNTIERALKTFDAPYILTTDDDMYFPKYSFQSLASMLEDKPEYGVISLWCNPNYSKVKWADMELRHLKLFKFTEGFHDVTCLGSATAMWRREVFDTCKYDQNYVIGNADFDLCLQLEDNDWKRGVMCLKHLKPLNNKVVNTASYNRVRNNTIEVKKSNDYFKKKWSIGKK